MGHSYGSITIPPDPRYQWVYMVRSTTLVPEKFSIDHDCNYSTIWPSEFPDTNGGLSSNLYMIQAAVS